jgi:hypothetical protein
LYATVATGFSVTINVAVEVPSLPVRVAEEAVVTPRAVAVKGADVEPAATETEAGTVREALLELSVTVCGAVDVPDRVTVQESVPAPVIEP